MELSFRSDSFWGNVQIGFVQGIGFAVAYVLIVHLIAPRFIK